MAGDITFGVRLQLTDDGYVAGVDSGTAANQRFVSSTSQVSTEFQKLMDRTDPLGAKLRQLTADQAALSAEMQKGTSAVDFSAVDRAYANLASDIAATKAAMAGAGEEAGKTAVSMSTVTRELGVLGREAANGNYTRMAGSFSILANALGVIPLLLNPITLALIAVGAAVGVFAVAAAKGAAESERFQNALILTGNAAGQTEGTMRTLAASIEATSNVTIGTAKEMVTALVSSGKLGSDSIQAIAGLAAQYAEATGQDVQKVTEQLAKMFEDPVKVAETLNSSMHLLSVADLQYIDHLKNIGELEQARLVTLDALNKRVGETIPQSLGILATAWIGIKKYASDAWDAMMGIGRQSTLEEQIATLQKQLAAAAPAADSGEQAILDAKQRQLAVLQAQLAVQRQQVDVERQKSAENDKQVLAAKLYDSTQQHQLSVLKDQLTLAQSIPDPTQRAAATLDIQTKIAAIYRSMGADARTLAQEQITSEQQLADVAIESLQNQNDADLALGKITKAQHDEEANYYIWLKNQEAQIATAALASVVGLTAKEQGVLAVKLAQLKAQEDLINLQGRNQQAIDAKAETDAETKAMNDLESAIVKTQEADLHRLETTLAATIQHNAEIGKTKEQIDLMKAAVLDAEAVQLQASITAINSAIEEGQAIDENVLVAWIAVRDEQTKQLAVLQQTQAAMSSGAALEASTAAAKAYQAEWTRALNYVQQGVATLIDDILVKHESLKQVWDDFKNWAFKVFAEIAAKQIIVSIAGAIGLGGAATAAGASSGLGSLATLLSGAGGASQLAGGGGIAGLFPGAAGFLSSLPSVGVAFENLATIIPTFSAALETGATAVEAASVAFAGTAASLAVAIPVIGAFVAAAYLAYQYFSQAKGGPKQGGAYSDVAGANLYPGETTASNNALIQGIVQGVGQSFAAYFRALGGTGAPGAAFGLGYDTDPEGTAQSRVSGIASVGGQTVFNQLDQNAGRDDASLQAGLQQEAARAILAALQATDLPAVVHDYLETIDAGTATLDQISTALQHAQELQRVVSGLAAMNLPGLDISSLAEFAQGTETIGQTFDRVSSAYNAFVQSFTTPTEKLQEETDLVNQTFAALGVAVPDSVTAYRQLVQSIDLSTDAGRQMFSALVTISPAFLDVANSVTTATGAIVSAADEAKLLNDKLSLQAQIYALTGDTAAAAAVQEQQRQIAIAALDPSLQGLQRQLYDLQDAAAASAAASQAQAAADQAAAAAAQAAAAIESKRSDLEIQIMQLSGDAAGALAAQRQLELAALDATLQPLQEQVYALEDQAAAAQAAAQAQQAADQAAAQAQQQATTVANAQVQEEITLMQEQGNAAGALALQREQELALMDPLLRDTQEAIYQYQDLNAAIEAANQAAAAQAELDKQAANLQVTLMQDQGDAAGALALKRQLELATLDASLQPLQEAIYAQEDLNAANQAAAQAAADAAQQMKDWIASLNALDNAWQGYQEAVSKHAGGGDLQSAQIALAAALDIMQRMVPGVDSLEAALALTSDQLQQLTPDQIGYVTAVINSATAVDQATAALAQMNAQLVQTYDQATARFRPDATLDSLTAGVNSALADMFAQTGLSSLDQVLALTNDQWIALTDTGRASVQAFLNATGALDDFNAAAAQAAAAIAQTVQTILDTVGGDPLAQALAANSTAWDKLIAQGNAVDQLAAYYDGTAAATNALNTATQQYHQSLVQMIGTIEQLKGSIADLFSANIRDFTLSGLDKQGQYAFLQSEVANAMAELQTATDPARINALAQLVASDQKQAYGLLSPDQQNAVRQQFIDGANAANALLQQRLQAAEDAAEARNAQLVDDIKTAISDAMTAAAAPIATAGDKMQKTADENAASADVQAGAAAGMAAAVQQLLTKPLPIVVVSDSSAVGTYG